MKIFTWHSYTPSSCNLTGLIRRTQVEPEMDDGEVSFEKIIQICYVYYFRLHLCQNRFSVGDRCREV